MAVLETQGILEALLRKADTHELFKAIDVQTRTWALVRGFNLSYHNRDL